MLTLILTQYLYQINIKEMFLWKQEIEKQIAES